VLVFMGAEQDSPSDAESRRAFFESFWRSRPRFSIEWTHQQGPMRCTSIQVWERGEMFADARHLFLIEEGGEQRLESATIRQPAYWSWAALTDAFAEAGFAALETRQFPGMGRGGTTLALNVAMARGQCRMPNAKCRINAE
jgi:hypothetical protein